LCLVFAGIVSPFKPMNRLEAEHQRWASVGHFVVQVQGLDKTALGERTLWLEAAIFGSHHNRPHCNGLIV
jgi:hypothetical protein